MDERLHPTTGQKVTVVKVSEFSKHRKVYFKAKGAHGYWVEYKRKEKA